MRSGEVVMSACMDFNALVLREYLPKFCDYYGYPVAGFRVDTLGRINEYDAMWFLQALRTRTVVQQQAFFSSALSGAREQIFWQGSKSISPRPITIWVEPVITIGAAGRLHSEFCWPQDLIGLQSKKSWAFDLVAYSRTLAPLVACEVKKTRREIDYLIQAMIGYLSQPPLKEEPTTNRLRNAYRKVVGLRQMRPRLFWALGPDNYGKVFRFVQNAGAHTTRLDEVDHDALIFSENGTL